MDTLDQRHADRVRRNMELTIENIVRAQNSIPRCSDKNIQSRLRLKNERRIRALDSMRRHVNGETQSFS